MSIPDSVYELVEKFESDKARFTHDSYKEAQLRQEFVNPLFSALGWQIGDSKQVLHEAGIRSGGRVKHPDYTFLAGSRRAFYVETKRPAVDISKAIEPAIQVRSYGWSGDTAVGILTNFADFAVYDCRVEPQQGETPDEALIRRLSSSQYIDEWSYLQETLSREAVLQGKHRNILADVAKGIMRVDDAFLRDMERWREELAKHLYKQALFINRTLNNRELNHLVQRTIDRIVFLRILEDRDLERYGRLEEAASVRRGVYSEIKKLYLEADKRYNSGLFHFDPTDSTRRKEDADELSLEIYIVDNVLRKIIGDLYPPKSQYQFSVMPADILGQVYERFLGNVIDVYSDGENTTVSVEKKPEVPKGDGVYYTPAYIVDYIVKLTLEKLLEGKNPEEAQSLRILDPACGSGSFLTGAYQYLLDWHLDIYRQEPHRYGNRICHSVDGILLTTEEKKRILQDNIFGIDLDQNAVEVSKLSLLLKMLENENEATRIRHTDEPILPDLGNNIKWGNSLVGSEFFPANTLHYLSEEDVLDIKPFDWESKAGFHQIMASGGFHAIVGNPPWGSKEVLENNVLHFISEKYERESHNLNVFAIFIDECLEHLLAFAGRLGFLIPKNFTKTEAYMPYRRDILANHSLDMVVDFGQFPGVAQEAVGLFITAKQRGTDRIFRKFAEGGQYYDLESLSAREIQSDRFLTITLARMPNLTPLMRKLESNSFRLGDKFRIGRGLEHGRSGNLICCPLCGVYFERPGKKNRNVKAVTCKTCRGLVDISSTTNNAKFIFKNDESVSISKIKGLLVGDSIERYLLKNIPFKAQLELPGINYKDLDTMHEKLYFIRIAQTLRGYLDRSGLLALNALNYVYKSNDAIQYKLQYVLGVLNSRLLKTYVEFSITGGANLTIRLSNEKMRSLPIAYIDFDNPSDVDVHDRMVELVDRMLDLHKEIQNDNVILRGVIEQQIERTDREIDNLVYKLYDLTPAEIAIVEGS